MPGLGKREFLNQISDAIEDASLALLPDGFEPAGAQTTDAKD